MARARAPARRLLRGALAKGFVFAAYSVGLVCWRGIGERSGLLRPLVLQPQAGDVDTTAALGGDPSAAAGAEVGIRALRALEDGESFAWGEAAVAGGGAAAPDGDAAVAWDSWSPARAVCESMAVTYAVEGTGNEEGEAPVLYSRTLDCAQFAPRDACRFLRQTFGVDCMQTSPGMGSGIYDGELVEIFTPPGKSAAPYMCESYLALAGSSLWSRDARIVLYLLALLYCFLGVAIVADVFMNAIEVITSKEKTRMVKGPNGKEYKRTYLVWNGTVANLTLMALGSSAPEILLSLMETLLTLEETPGEIGPSTIVGSAAFNLLIISSVCVSAPEGVKRVKQYGVYSITSFFSIWAYVWLYIVLAVWTPDEVSMAEAAITVGQFPLLVFLAYGADVNWRFLGGGSKAVSPSKTGPDLSTQIEALEEGKDKKEVKFAEGEEEDHRSNYLQYRTNAVRFLSGGARVRLVAQMSMKKSQPLGLPDEEALLAEGLPASSPDGASLDPYVKVKFGKQVKETDWVKRNINPIFLDTLMFEGKNLKLPFEVAVWDHDDLSADDFVGGAVLEGVLLELADGAVAERSLTLKDDAGRKMGMLDVIVRKLDSMADAPPMIEFAIVRARSLPGLERSNAIGDSMAACVGDMVSSAKRAFGKRWEAALERNVAYIQQFKDAMHLHGDLDDDGSELEPLAADYIMHALTLFWKLLFAFIPPAEYYGGWLCFGVALSAIGAVTFVVGELASLFGCVVGLKDSVTAITFVALGTSLPDTFASKMAAENEPTADNSLGNITGSNAVNVFLGIGLPWLVAAAYKLAKYGTVHAQPQGALGISLAAFISCALVCLAWLAVRRRLYGGELGGPKGPATLFVNAMGALWMLYILISSFKAYDYF